MSGTIPIKVCIFGSRGFVGSGLVDHLKTNHQDTYQLFLPPSSVRINNQQHIDNYLDTVLPDIVINAAGRVRSSHVQTIDFLEEYPEQSIQDNLIAPLLLGLTCISRNIYYVCVMTGCIYSYPDLKHPLDTKPFTEQDKPNFDGSVYSFTKGLADNVMTRLLETKILSLRIRMPIVPSFHEHGIIGKALKYKKIHDLPNSMTSLEDMFVVLCQMMSNREKGVFNMVNSGYTSLSKIRDLVCSVYQLKRPENDLFSTQDQQRQSTAAPRSNNILCLDKLISKGYYMPDVNESIYNMLVTMQRNGVKPCQEWVSL